MSRAPVAICWQSTLGQHAADAGGRVLEGDVHDSVLDGMTPHLGATSIERAVTPTFDERYPAGEDVEWWLRVTREMAVTTTPSVRPALPRAYRTERKCGARWARAWRVDVAGGTRRLVRDTSARKSVSSQAHGDLGSSRRRSAAGAAMLRPFTAHPSRGAHGLARVAKSDSEPAHSRCLIASRFRSSSVAVDRARRCYAAMLDAHSDIAVPYESYFPVWFGRRRGRYETSDGFALEQFVDDLLAHESFRRWSLADVDVRAALTEARPHSYPDAIRACYALYARTDGKPRYGDKTPVFVSHIPFIATTFPESVFVHIIRDGRTVVLSRAEAAWGTDRIDFEALLWRSQVTKGRADGLALGSDRYHEVRYEDLVDDPERVAKELCRFVEIDFDPVMLDYHEQATRIVDEQPFPDEHRNLLATADQRPARLEDGTRAGRPCLVRGARGRCTRRLRLRAIDRRAAGDCEGAGAALAHSVQFDHAIPADAKSGSGVHSIARHHQSTRS